MAVDRASFRVAFPEFAQCSDALVDQRLAEAEDIHPVKRWCNEELRDSAIRYYTAHSLTISPSAKALRLEDGTSIYLGEWNRLRRAIAIPSVT